MGGSLRAKPVGVVRWIEWVLTQSKLNDKSDQKFLERVLPARDCEKPNIELVLKTTFSNIQNHDIVKITT